MKRFLNHSKSGTVVLVLMYSMFCSFAAVPTISSFTPTSGTIGTEVTIAGSNFNTTPSNNFVFLGATRATVSAATATSLTVTVQAGATFQPVSVTDITNNLTAFSARPFITTFGGGATINANSFATRNDFTSGWMPTNISVIDFDGDGKTDLAVINANDKTVSIFRNISTNGTIAFSDKIDYATGIAPSYSATGDIDGDGKPDFVVSNGASNTISIYRNISTIGSIAFAAKVDFSTGLGPGALIINDLDGDGKSDIAVVNSGYGSNSLSVYRNTSTSGTITFEDKVDFITGLIPYGLVSCDLDGDNKPDLALVNIGFLDNSISILRNTSTIGSISFASKVDYGIDSPGSISSGDIDGDGKYDLVVSHKDTVSVYRNTSIIGTFSFASRLNYNVGSYTNSISIGDLDGDGKPELILVSPDNNAISVFQNTSLSGISFVSKVDYASGTNPSCVSVCDLDNDGRPDIVAANSLSSTISVFRNKIAQPKINSFSPASGAIGTTVTITGTNFNTTPAKNIVFFGATRATVSVASANSLKVTVPTGATYLPISVSDITTSLTTYSARPFVTTFIGGAAFDANSFAAKIDYTAGTTPWCVSIGDIDGDGKPDLIIANYSSINKISVFRNNSISGNVSFDAKVDFLTGMDPTFVSVGDLDGDGKPDIAVANLNSNTVSVLKNTSSSGIISFSAKVDYTTGTNPNSISIGDLNDDGKPDLAVTNQQSNTVSVFRNTSSIGTISFAAKVDFTSGTFPFSASIGDLDGDGKPDIAVANLNSKSVSVFRNKITNWVIDTSSFSAKFDYTTGTSPISISIGDLDGDGKPDIAVANDGSNTISVIRNTSTSGIINASSFAGKIDFTTGAFPVSVSISDLDGDGKPDLAAANYSSSKVSVLRNTCTIGSVSFAAKVDYTSGTNPNSVSIGDLDGDGKPDIAIANSNSNTISVIRNTLTPPIPTVTNFSPNSGAVGTTVSISGTNFNTLTGNNIVYFGATRAIVSSATATSLTVIVPTGATYQPISITDNFTGLTAYSAKPFITTYTGGSAFTASSFASKIDNNAGTQPSDISIIDLDGDGKSDLAVTNYGSNNVSIYHNTGTSGTISFTAKVDFTACTTLANISTGDLDGDGKPDLVVANSEVNSISIFRNTSTIGNFSFEAKIDYSTGSYPQSVSICDLDGDGKPDLAIANYGSNTVSVFLNKSTNGIISFASKVDFSTGSFPSCVSINDLDDDSKPDLVVTNSNSNTISVLRNLCTNGTISFATKIDFATATSPNNVSIGDLDGDGKPDLAVANISSNSVSVFRNISTIGAVTFASKVDYSSGTQAQFVSIGDLDGDGKPDLAVANRIDFTVSVFRNTCTSGNISFAAKVDYITGTGPNSVTIGDLDGDGKPDLAISNFGSNTISLLRNTNSPPTIASFNPNSGTTGTSITITGDYFTGVSTVNFGGTSASSYNVVSPTKITAIIAAGTTGNVSVTTPRGTAILAGFTYKLSQTITFNPLSPVNYGDSAFALSATGGASGNPVTFTSSDTTVATCTGTNGATVTIIKAGTCTIYADQASNDIYYMATQVSQGLTINPKALAITGVSANNKIYNGTIEVILTGGSLIGIVGSDEVTLNAGYGVFENKNVGIGKIVNAYGYTLSGAKASNYKLAAQPSELTANITPASLSTTGVTASNKVYDGTASATLNGGSLTGIIGTEEVTLNIGIGAFIDKNVGNFKTIIATGYSLAGTDSGNYILAAQPSGLTANITPASLSITGVMAANKIYDGTLIAPLKGGSLSGIYGTDVVTITAGSGAFEDKNVGFGKSVTASGYALDGSDSGNYILTAQPSGLMANITAASLTVIADSKSKTYGNVNPALTISYNGFVNGEDQLVITEPTAICSATNLSSAGSYVITLTGGSALNYNLFPVNGFLTVNKAMLTATADNKTRMAGTANLEFTITYTGFKNGETNMVLDAKPVASCIADISSIAGEYEIKVTGGNDDNYNFMYVSGKLTITTASEIEDVPTTGYNVFPNPAKDYIVINSPNSSAPYVKIFDIFGNLVIESKVLNEQLNLQRLKSGIYIIKIDNYNFKFIKE